MKCDNFKQGDIITITKNDNDEIKKFICIHNFNIEYHDNNGKEYIWEPNIYYYIGLLLLNNEVQSFRQINPFEVNQNMEINMATEEEEKLFFHELTNLFKIENESSIKYFTDSTYFEILTWIIERFNLIEHEYVENYPDFIYNIREIIWNILNKQLCNSFDPYTLKTFDKVLTRNNNNEPWNINVFGKIIKQNDNIMFKTINGIYNQCIPFNTYTEDLYDSIQEPEDYYNIFD
jgi:hypothetical protein